MYKEAGSLASGPLMSLYYDMEYKEEDADIEVCLPMRKRGKSKVVDFRRLEAGKFISFIHVGPYKRLGESYASMFDYVRKEHLTLLAPMREIYLKGPGLVFRGNPEKYRTKLLWCMKEK